MSEALPAIEERIIDGNYGEIFHNGKYQGDFRDFTGRIAIERREIPRAGTTGVVYRRGRISRDGTLRIAKVDSRFEALLIDYANTSEEEKRIRRGQGIPTFPDTQLTIKLDDPDSWGSEIITIFGVKFWEIGIGFTQNDMVERDIPVTWQREAMPKAIPRPGNKQGAAASLNQGDITTYPAAARQTDPVI
jgi:hypothetical protein